MQCEHCVGGILADDAFFVLKFLGLSLRPCGFNCDSFEALVTRRAISLNLPAVLNSRSKFQDSVSHRKSEPVLQRTESELPLIFSL